MTTPCPVTGKNECTPDNAKRRAADQAQYIRATFNNDSIDTATKEYRISHHTQIKEYLDGLHRPQCSTATIITCLRRHLASETDHTVLTCARVALELCEAEQQEYQQAIGAEV